MSQRKNIRVSRKTPPEPSSKAWRNEATKLLWSTWGDQVGTCNKCGHPGVKGYIHCTQDSVVN